MDGWSLDEVYEQVQHYGPEFDGWLSNHAPMAADALGRIGGTDRVGRWLDAYSARLEPPPAQERPLTEATWREALGDPRRLGDWTRWFSAMIGEASWQEVLVAWWPRLLPGALAAATHPLIRVGHAVRALGEADTEPRRRELAAGLAYFAARWQPAAVRAPLGKASPATALATLPPLVGASGGIRQRIVALEQAADAPSDGVHAPRSPAAVPTLLDELVDATIAQYATAPGIDAVMLVHASTAPRAARLTLAALLPSLWIPTYEVAWTIAAALTRMYRTPHDDGTRPRAVPDREALIERATAHGDEHVLKFVEVAMESYARGHDDALAAAARALGAIDPLEGYAH